MKASRLSRSRRNLEEPAVDRRSRTAVASVPEEVPTVEGIPPDDSVRMYLREIGRVQLLSPEEEVELAKQLERATILSKLLAVWSYGLEMLGREPKFPEIVRAIENFSDAELKNEIGVIDHVIKRLAYLRRRRGRTHLQHVHEEVQSYLQHCLDDIKTKQMLLLRDYAAPDEEGRRVGKVELQTARWQSRATRRAVPHRSSEASTQAHGARPVHPQRLGSNSGRRPAARKRRRLPRATRKPSADTTRPASSSSPRRNWAVGCAC